jgi:hypothetical protein
MLIIYMRLPRYCFRVNYNVGHVWLPIKINMPNALATITVHEHRPINVVPGCTLCLHKPVSSYILLGIICKTPVQIKRRAPDKVVARTAEAIGRIEDIQVDSTAQLLPSSRDWKTNIIIHHLSVGAEFNNSLGSLLELLDLSRRREDPHRPVGRICEYRLWHGFHDIWSDECGWDAHLYMDVDEWQVLIKLVSILDLAL